MNYEAASQGACETYRRWPNVRWALEPRAASRRTRREPEACWCLSAASFSQQPHFCSTRPQRCTDLLNACACSRIRSDQRCDSAQARSDLCSTSPGEPRASAAAVLRTRATLTKGGTGRVRDARGVDPCDQSSSSCSPAWRGPSWRRPVAAASREPSRPPATRAKCWKRPSPRHWERPSGRNMMTPRKRH